MPPQGESLVGQVQTAPQPAPVTPLSMGKFKASKLIVKQSWAILRQDKEIMWFPILSAITNIFALVIIGVFLFVFTLGGDTSNLETVANEESSGATYLVLFIVYLVSFFIVNFFESGIFVIAHGRFNGQDLSFRDGMNGAIANIEKIAVWSLISATVGVVLRMIADRSKLIGKIVVSLLGAAWNIMTYFSLPSLIIGGKSVKESFKDSASVIRKTWGETIIVNIGVGLFVMLLFFLGLAFTIGIMIIAPIIEVVFGMIVLFILYIIALSVISSALGTIYKLAIYEYATTGKIPMGFSPELIQNALRGKK